MYPDRLWLALGSGEAINEAITGISWPDKQERNAHLLE
jgi:coenzyme F420-dependent glucose-6-phosphate dehydrogenase